MSGSMAGGVDAGIALQAGRGVSPPVNPLQLMEKFALTKNLLNENRLFPGQLALQGQQVQGGQLNLAHHFYQATNEALLPLLALPAGTITHSDLTSALAGIEESGVSTNPWLRRYMTTVGALGDGPRFDAGVRAMIAPGSQTDAGAALGAVVPHPGPVLQTGQTIQGTTLSPAAASAPNVMSPAGAPVQQYPSRAEIAQPAVYTDAHGVRHQTTLGGYNAAVGSPPGLLGPAGAVVGAPRAAPAPGGVVGVAGPVSPQHPPRLTDVAPASAAPGIPGPAPGYVPSAEAASVGNTGQYLAFQQSTNNLPQQKALLGNLEGEVKNFTSGPYAETINAAKRAVNELTPIWNPFPPSTIGTQEEFNKQAFQLAQQQFQALGGTGTDAKLDSTMHTSPSALLSQYGNEGIINILKGNVDALQAMRNEWQTNWLPQHDNNTGTFGQFVQQFNKHFDPRVFQSTYMDYKNRQEMFAGMSKGEKEAFTQDYNWAAVHGWLPAPTQPTPAAAAP